MVATSNTGGPLDYTYTSVSLAEPTDSRPKLQPVYSVNSVPEVWKRPRWKPFTLRTPFLVVFFLITVVIIAMIEVLYQKSSRNQGLFFADDLVDFTMWEVFSYKYLMTIISVLYGMVWASVDLDVKRLEPFFQLATSKGATAADSILLCYPFDFLAFVPVLAFTRRHWSVFYAGFALVLIFWVITPMQAALLTTVTVKINVPTEFVSYQNFAPYDSQSWGNETSAQYFYTSYGICWLEQELPPFTTMEYAAMPFKPLGGTARLGGKANESWTAVTRRYTTDLDCKPGTRVSPENPFEVQNDSGCKVPVSPVTDSDWTGGLVTSKRKIQYLAGGDWEGFAEYYLTCKNNTHIFVALLQEAPEIPAETAGPSPDTEIVSAFCRASYHYIDSKVTVDAKTLQIMTEEPGNPVPFTQDDKVIDIRRFEWDVSSGAVNSQDNGMDFPTAYMPSGTSMFYQWGLGKSTRILTFTIGASKNLKFEDLKDPKVLGAAFSSAHKLLFANYVHSLLRDQPEEKFEKQKILGNRTILKWTVVVVGLFARLLEAFLVVVAICFAALGIILFRRGTNLSSDPDSLGAKMAFVADSKALLQDFDGLDEAPHLQKVLPNRTYRLDNWNSNGYYQIDFENDSGTQLSRTPNIAKQYSGAAVRPFVLSTSMGVILILFLAGTFGFLVYLYQYTLKNNGLPTLSNNQIVAQIIFSIIPTVLATGMEPFWVLLTRYFCVYQPYTELAKGKASPSRSLSLKYTNIPPALVFLRALRTKNFILFSLSAIAFFANLLAVSFGGLFNNEMRPLETPTTFSQPYAATIRTILSPQNYIGNVLEFYDLVGSFVMDPQEPWIVTASNITEDVPHPPWVTREYYFLPFKWEYSQKNSKTYKAITHGFGADLDCQPLESGNFEAQVSLMPTKDFSINITLPTDDGRKVRCKRLESDYYFNQLAGKGGVGQRVALEYSLRMVPEDQKADQGMNDACQSVHVIGWGRALYSGSSFTDLNGQNLVCHQKLRAARFKVTVDESGRVLQYDKIMGSDIDPAGLFRGNTTMQSFAVEITRVAQSVGEHAYFWHNNTFTGLVPHYLINILLHANLLSPNEPLANFSTLSDGYNQYFRRLFPNILARNSERIFQSNSKLIDGFEVSIVQRVAMDKVMFYISIIIMGLNIIVGVLAYIFRPKNLLPRFPDTIASEIAYFYSSQALMDVSGTVSMSSSSRDKHLNRLGHEYGFGEFRGRDGKKHRGVERSSLIEWQ